ncbi:MAG: glycosyltransferase [Acidimicrobiia bacterium]
MSTILVVVPDYASHYFPLSAVGETLQSRGNRVVVATGPGLRSRVVADGFEHRRVGLGPGSNSGLLRTDSQSLEEQRQMELFFDASRQGMVPTHLHQARNRQRDLLHQPERVAQDMSRLLGDVRPDGVVVDQLAFGATAALRGLGRRFISFHPGHPSAISTGWPYGYPPRIPKRIRVDVDDLAELKALCQQVVNRFTSEYNDAVLALDSSAELVPDAFAAVSPCRTVINFPTQLAGAYPLPHRVSYIGSSIRHQDLPRDLARSHTRRPRIYASLGSFFSGRIDILQKLVSAFRNQNVELMLASGTTPRSELGNIPEHWTVSEYLPQPALLRTADLAITHGGNNTVTEALTAGVPLLVGPLSTDQFAAAADIESAGLGATFDPNFDDASTISDLAAELLSGDAPVRAAELARELQAEPGKQIAASLVEASLGDLASV